MKIPVRVKLALPTVSHVAHPQHARNAQVPSHSTQRTPSVKVLVKMANTSKPQLKYAPNAKLAVIHVGIVVAQKYAATVVMDMFSQMASA
jgi:hypothetical protein